MAATALRVVFRSRISIIRRLRISIVVADIARMFQLPRSAASAAIIFATKRDTRSRAKRRFLCSLRLRQRWLLRAALLRRSISCVRWAISESAPGATVVMNNGSPLRFLLPLCALLSGCGESVEQPLEQVSEKSYAVDRDTNFNIKNGDGSIRIYGSDKPEMKVQAIKKAYSGERLNKIAINISVRPRSVSIETHFPPKQTWGFSDRSGTVDYIIVVPKTAKISHLELANGEVLIDSMGGEDVHANLTNGRLFAHNCFGDLHLAVISGGLDLIYVWGE